jgi:Domain of unknown function (DUF4824)
VRGRLLWLAGTIVLVMNATALVSVSMNRRGQPTNLIELTHRELPMQYRTAENSAVFLRLNWHGEIPESPDRFRRGLNWFDRAKLSEIGFDTSMPVTDPRAAVHYRRMRSRRAYVVLEHEGQRWSEWLSWHADRIAGANSPEERERLERERDITSRLFAIDAGLSGPDLRTRYPDQSKFLIVPASVRIVPVFDPDDQGQRVLRELRGNVQHLLVSQIYVPQPFSSLFQSIRPEPGRRPGGSLQDPAAPVYRVTLRYGSRYEPQVIQARTGAATVQ